MIHFMEGRGVVFSSLSELGNIRDDDLIPYGAVVCLIALPTNQLDTAPCNVVGDDLLGSFICLGRIRNRLSRGRVLRSKPLTLVDMEHGEVFEIRDLLLLSGIFIKASAPWCRSM